MIDNKQHCKIDGLNDIVGGIGLAYTYLNESGDTIKNQSVGKSNNTSSKPLLENTNSNRNRNRNNNDNVKGSGIITNCVLLRCCSDELSVTLKKCYIIAYFRKLNKNEYLEIPQPNS